MNSMVIGKTLVRLSLFGKPIWNISIQIMPWIVAIVTGKSIHATSFHHQTSLENMVTSKILFVVDGCSVDGCTVKHSILSTEAQVREGAVVEDAVVMSNAIIGKGAVVKRAIIGEGAIIAEGVGLMEQRKYKLSVTMKSGVATDED